MLSSEREGLKQGGNFRGSFYLTEIKQVHSEDDKIIIIDTFEGCQVLLEHH